MCRDVCQQDTTVTALWASVEVASPEGCRPCPVPIEHPSELDEHGRPKVLAVKREVAPKQARWGRKIFEWYAEGYSPRWIANELNCRGVPFF